MPFTPPIGTEEERSTGQAWPGTWVDATPYLTRYALGYHTGADLNNNLPRHDSDAHAPVYSIGDGKVTYAQLVSKKYWGNLIVIDHGIVDGMPLFSRYGHIEAMTIKVGDVVKTGQQIAKVGNGEGLFPYHLHFDISTTAQLRTMPTYWPGNDRQGVKHHFVDPKAWLNSQHTIDSLPDNVDLSSNSNASRGTTDNSRPKDVQPTPQRPAWYVIAPQGISVHKSPSASAEKLGTLLKGSKISIGDSGVKNEDLIWVQVFEGNFKDGWVTRGKANQSETYLSTNPPR